MTGTASRALVRGRRPLLGLAVALCLAVPAAGVSTSRADVDVAGTASDLRVTTSQDRAAEVLAVLATRFSVKYRAAVPLDHTLSGTYSGSLEQVLSRLLEGYNYVTKHDGGTIEVIVFGKNGERPVAVQQPAPASKGITSRWR